MVLDIKLRSLLKWQFEAFDGETLIASIDLKALREGADLRMKGEPFRIFRESLLSGAFVLEAFGEELARAEKPSAFRRRFVIHFAGRRFELEAVSLFGRSFVMLDQGSDGAAQGVERKGGGEGGAEVGREGGAEVGREGSGDAGGDAGGEGRRGVGREVGRIEPVAWYKQSATATFNDDLPLAVVVFVVTLALLMWKRSAKSSS